MQAYVLRTCMMNHHYLFEAAEEAVQGNNLGDERSNSTTSDAYDSSIYGYVNNKVQKVIQRINFTAW